MIRSIGIRDSYKLYRKEVKNPTNRDNYLEIAEGFSKFIIEKLMEGEAVRLPERMGVFQFIGVKVKPHIKEDGTIGGLSPNWRATNELWEKDPRAKEEKTVVYHFNEHTSGVRYRMFWSKKHMYIPNKDFYTFVLSRYNKRKFNSLLLEGKEYLVLQSKLNPYVRIEKE